MGFIPRKSRIDLQYQNETYNELFSNTKIADQTNRFGAKYLIYDPFRIMKKINIHSWKANRKFSWRQLVPAVSLFAGLILRWRKTHSFLQNQHITKIILITQNHLGDGKWVL
jgi:hypothetical protein